MSTVRSNKASISLLDPLRVDDYGVPAKLSSMATLAVPERRLITIKPGEVIYE